MSAIPVGYKASERTVVALLRRLHAGKCLIYRPLAGHSGHVKQSTAWLYELAVAADGRRQGNCCL